MAKGKGTTSMWKTILQITLAVLLIIGGLSVFMKAPDDPLIKAVGSIFNGQVKTIVVYVLAVVEIICGVLLILDFCNIKALDKLDDIFLLIIMICWIVVFIVLGDIIPLVKGQIKFLPFLVQLAKDAIMVAAMGIIKAKI